MRSFFPRLRRIAAVWCLGVGVGQSIVVAQSAAPNANPDVPTAAPKPEPAPKKASAPKAITPQDLHMSVKEFVEVAICRTCSGTGTREETSATPPMMRSGPNGPTATTPLVQKRTVNCRTCDRVGLAKTDVLYQKGGVILRAMDRLATAPADEKLLKAKEFTQASLRKLATYGGGLRRRLNDGAITKLSANEAPGETPIMLVGRLDSDTPQGNGRTMEVSFHGDSKHVVMQDPLLVDSSTGDVVLIGGIFDRRETVGDDAFGGVLRHGFVIRVTDPETIKDAGVGEANTPMGNDGKRRNRGR